MQKPTVRKRTLSPLAARFAWRVAGKNPDAALHLIRRQSRKDEQCLLETKCRLDCTVHAKGARVVGVLKLILMPRRQQISSTFNTQLFCQASCRHCYDGRRALAIHTKCSPPIVLCGDSRACFLHIQYGGEDLTTVDVHAHVIIGIVMVSITRRSRPVFEVSCTDNLVFIKRRTCTNYRRVSAVDTWMVLEGIVFSVRSSRWFSCDVLETS